MYVLVVIDTGNKIQKMDGTVSFGKAFIKDKRLTTQDIFYAKKFDTLDDAEKHKLDYCLYSADPVSLKNLDINLNPEVNYNSEREYSDDIA